MDCSYHYQEQSFKTGFLTRDEGTGLITALACTTWTPSSRSKGDMGDIPPLAERMAWTGESRLGRALPFRFRWVRGCTPGREGAWGRPHQQARGHSQGASRGDAPPESGKVGNGPECRATKCRPHAVCQGRQAHSSETVLTPSTAT